MANVMQQAWKNYRIARQCVFAKGDESGVRSFIRSIFVAQLRRAWAEAKKASALSRQFAEETARAKASAAADLSRRASTWASATPAQIASEIQAITHQIDHLIYLPLSVSAEKVGRELRADLAALQSISNTIKTHEAA